MATEIGKDTKVKLSLETIISSAALIIAGIIADGNSKIYGLEHLDRGYENFESKLKMLGVEIKREFNTKTYNENEYSINPESEEIPKYKVA